MQIENKGDIIEIRDVVDGVLQVIQFPVDKTTDLIQVISNGLDAIRKQIEICTMYGFIHKALSIEKELDIGYRNPITVIVESINQLNNGNIAIVIEINDNMDSVVMIEGMEGIANFSFLLGSKYVHNTTNTTEDENHE